MLGKTKLRHMDVGRLKLVVLLQSHLAAGITTTRPRNSILDEFLLNGLRSLLFKEGQG